VTDGFLTLLNESVQQVPRLPRVRFEASLNDEATHWIRKKHADGAVHEPGTIGAFWAIRQRKDCKTIYDVGALYGYFSLLSSMLFSEADITAFEMHPGCIVPLSQNVAPAPCVFATVTDECRKDVKIWISGFNIFEEPEGGWGQLESVPGAMKDRGENNRGRGFSKTAFITLDSWCENHTPPDLIKIDVEGYQAKAIAGAMSMIREHRPAIIVELHDPEKLERFGTTNAETVQPLFDAGYKAYWCGNFRGADATYEDVTQMGEKHERLSIMVFVDEAMA
jgi:FkbM family methyltransferase